MPFREGQAKTDYQRDYMRRRRAPYRIERLTRQLAELEQLTGRKLLNVRPEPPVALPKIPLTRGSPPCLLDFKPAPSGTGFTNFQSWRK
jgi:hypothetical protein